MGFGGIGLLASVHQREGPDDAPPGIQIFGLCTFCPNPLGEVQLRFDFLSRLIANFGLHREHVGDVSVVLFGLRQSEHTSDHRCASHTDYSRYHPKRVGVTEFESLDKAKAWIDSPERKVLAPQREKAVKFVRQYIVEGK
jgi:hypothetical protein